MLTCIMYKEKYIPHLVSSVFFFNPDMSISRINFKSCMRKLRKRHISNYDLHCPPYYIIAILICLGLSDYFVVNNDLALVYIFLSVDPSKEKRNELLPEQPFILLYSKNTFELIIKANFSKIIYRYTSCKNQRH